MNRKNLFVFIGILLLTITIIAISFVLIFNGHRQKNIDDDIIGKTVSLEEGIEYCRFNQEVDLSDEFSKAYTSATTIKIIEINKEDLTATIEISSPPLQEIMTNCLSQDYSGDNKADLEKYMSHIISAVKSTPSESKITTKIECGLVEDNGLKILINSDFLSAVYPDLLSVFSEMFIDSVKGTEN